MYIVRFLISLVNGGVLGRASDPGDVDFDVCSKTVVVAFAAAVGVGGCRPDQVYQVYPLLPFLFRMRVVINASGLPRPFEQPESNPTNNPSTKSCLQRILLTSFVRPSSKKHQSTFDT